jgi:Zn-dependent oligopeptidase
MTTPEVLDRPPEVSLILQNFDRLTPEIVVADGDRMVAEATAYLAQACGETTPADDALPIVEVEEQPNALEALSRAMNSLGLENDDASSGILPYFVRDVHPEETVRDAGEEQRKRLQVFTNNIFSDPRYESAYEALRAMDETTLDAQDRQRRGYYLGRFEAARRNKQGETAADAEGYQQKLNVAAGEFRENKKKIATVLLTPAEFSALPAETKGQLKAEETEDGVAVLLNKPNTDYLLEHAGRAARKRAYDLVNGDQVAPNAEHLVTMAEARLKIAQSEGKSSWVEKQAEGLALDSPEAVYDFYDKTKERVLQSYQKAIAKLQALAKVDGITELAEYDLPYYERKLIEASYDANEVTFTLSRTFRGLTLLAERLLGVIIEESPETPVWADGVKAYTVRDAGTVGEAGEMLGSFYTDMRVREDKVDGGFTYALRYARTQKTGEGADSREETTQLPIAALVVSTAAPTADGTEPHMTLRNVEAIFHEFGHVAHTMLGRTRGPEYGGGKTKFDVQEIVSQAWEYIAMDPDVLLELADEGISEETQRAFRENLAEVQEVRTALYNMRLLRIMAADLALHGPEPSLDKAFADVEEIMAPVSTDNHWMLVQGSMSNSYSGRAGSTYLFDSIKARRIAHWLELNDYNPAVGRQLRRVLSLGGGPEATARLLEFADQSTAAAAGSAAIGDAS